MKIYAAFILILSLILTALGCVFLAAFFPKALIISLPLIVVGCHLFDWSHRRLNK